MLNYFDSGANLADAAFDTQLVDILARAKKVGVQRISVTGCSVDSSTKASALSKKFPELTSTVGVHPHNADEWTSDVGSYFDTLLENNDKIICLGEMGLDYYRNHQPKAVQIRAFVEQCQWANEKNMPGFLHMRDAHKDFYPIVSQHRSNFSKVVVHCFTGGKSELFSYLDLDCFIGITGWYCDPIRGTDLQHLIRHIPRDRLLIETDSPYLLPKNMSDRPKNRRNEPSFLAHIAMDIARGLDINIDTLAPQLWSNSVEFFGR